MSNTLGAPIAIFAFNRPEKLSAMFETLAQCEGFANSPVTFFVDGPRNDGDRPAVAKVRDFVSSLRYPNVTHIFRDNNLGLRRSICAGVTELCRTHGRVIVMEDDFKLSPGALNYFNAALEKYGDCPEIASVCGYMPDVSALRSHPRALILPATHPWGWATWQRAWTKFDVVTPVDPKNLSSRAFRERFNVHGIHLYTTMLRFALAGKLDSWFIRWHHAVCVRGGLSVFPPRSMVRNEGLTSGTHASRFNILRWLIPPTELRPFDFNLPDMAAADMWAIDAIARSREQKVMRWILRFGALKRTFR